MHCRPCLALVAIFNLSWSAEARPPARSTFPEKLEERGIIYKRLTGRSLAQAVLGRIFCPNSRCSGIDGMVEVFRRDGMWLAYGDRWEGEGKYVIKNGRIVVTFEQERRSYAVYASPDGASQRALLDNNGKVWLLGEFSKVRR